MAQIGKPTKLTPAIQEAIVQAVATGVSLSCAAEAVGVDQATACEWVRRGQGYHPRGATPRYAEFAAAITRARAEDELRRVTRIAEAARGGAVVYRKTTTMADGRIVTEERTQPPDWQADAWHLERARSQAWGRKDRLEMHLTIQQAALRVAEELGVTVDEVLAEAHALLNGPYHGLPEPD